MVRVTSSAQPLLKRPSSMSHSSTSKAFAPSRMPTAYGKLHTALLSLGVGAVGLGGCIESEPELEVASTTQASTVGSYTGGSSCSTAVVIGLSQQIADEVGCLSPNALVRVAATSRLTRSSSAALLYFEKSAATGLVAASQEGSLQVNSGFRTIAQQYLLYRWYVNGHCGITAAATVGHSNHEGGRAVDLANYSSRISIMSRHGWAHDVAGDPVHFDHTASADNRGLDTKAFQHLWNANHPSDKIAEDGDYGPQTESRLKLAPATGFAIGPSCAHAHAEASNVVAVDGPDHVAPGVQVHYAITIANTGTTDWPATTTLATADGQPSALYDSATWSSTSVFGTIGNAIPAGGQAVLDIDVMTPTVTEKTPVSEPMILTAGGQTLGTVDLAFTVVPGTDMTTPTSTDGDDQNDTLASTETGGCNAAGGAAGSTFAIGFAALAMVRRRRRV